MKKINIILSTVLAAFLMSSCVDYFLEKPETSGNLDEDEVYSSATTALEALAAVYRNALVHGWPSGWGAYHGALGSISGERYKGYSWHATWEISESGLKVSDVLNSREGTAGADNFTQNWSFIRAALLVKQNIDRVPSAEMTDTEKQWIKGEATALAAYRYMGMFYRYGGLPLLDRVLLPDDEVNIPRSTLQETLDFILGLCDEAYALLPDSWESQYHGRMTKGAVLMIKARVLTFAARPLFNSATPYLSNAETNELVCFGSADPSRWNDAIEAHEAVLEWANNNGYALINTGGAGTGNANPNARDDYGTAVSFPGNREVILPYKYNDTRQIPNSVPHYYNASDYWDWANNRFDMEYVGLLTNFLENYYFSDGTEPSWPQVGDQASTDAQVWYDNINRMEARFRVDYTVPFVETIHNPGDSKWSLSGWGKRVGNVFNWDAFPGTGQVGCGAGEPAKFYYRAGSRTWFEPPLFRLAETYLSLAEAYNEAGNSQAALDNLNMVHNRAGLPWISETNQAALRRIIWREKAIEFVGENHRYYDVKHWKHPQIDQGIIGGQMRELQFYTSAPSGAEQYLPGNLISFWDANSYVAFWHPRMYLEPIPQSEVNNGIIVQNPGY